MAINDNTLYGITGAQLKELPEKARKAGYKVLTTADYNWNNTAKDSTTTPFDSIALWLLGEGVYQWNPGDALVVRIGTGSSDVITTQDQLAVLLTVGKEQSVTYSGETVSGVHPLEIEMIGMDSGELTTNALIGYTVWDSSNNDASGMLIPYVPSVTANLGSTSDSEALAASQGKILKDLVDSLVIKNSGAPTSSTKGSVGQLLEDTTNGKLYICTAVSGATYTWTEAGTSYSAFTGATSGTAGTTGLVPAPASGETNKYLKSDGSWSTIPASGSTITMSSTDPGEGSALAANNYIGVYGGEPIILDYSTNEVDTGAKWVDGNAIYKKTINFGTLPNATQKDVSHGISSLSTIIKIEGFATDSSATINIPTASNSANSNIDIWVSSTNVSISTANDMSGYTTCYITLYYTKSS